MQVTIDRTVLDELDDDERTDGAHRAGRRARPRPATPKTVEGARGATSPTSATAPTCPVPVADDVPEDLKIWIDEHAEELPGRRGRAGRRPPLPLRPARRPRARLHRPDHRRRVRAGGRARPSRTRSTTRSGSTASSRSYEDDLRGTPGSRAIEVDAENQPIRDVGGEAADPRRRPRPQPRHRRAGPGRAGAARPGSPSPRTGRAAACKGPVAPEVGSTVVLDPQTGGVLAMASYPTFNPADFVDGISDAECAYLDDRGEQHPAEQPGHPGPVRARLDVQALHARSPPSTPGSSPPTRRSTTTASTRCPTARGDSCVVQQRQRQDVRRRRPAPLAHGVVRRLLLRARRPVLDRDRTALGGPEKFRRPPQAVGLRQGHRHRPARASSPAASRRPQWLERVLQGGRAARTAPTPGAPATTSTWRSARATCCSRRSRSPTRYATIGNGGTVWQPHVVKEVRDGVTKELKRTIEPKELSTDRAPARVAQAALRRAHRRDHPARRHRRRRLQRLPDTTTTRWPPRPAPPRCGDDARRPPPCSAPSARPPTRSTPSRCSSRSPATAARRPRRSPAGSSTSCRDPSLLAAGARGRQVRRCSTRLAPDTGDVRD